MTEVWQEAQQSLNALVTQWISRQTVKQGRKQLTGETQTTCKDFCKTYMDVNMHKWALRANTKKHMSWNAVEFEWYESL